MSMDYAAKALNDKLLETINSDKFAVAISLNIKNALNTITWLNCPPNLGHDLSVAYD